MDAVVSAPEDEELLLQILNHFAGQNLLKHMRSLQ